jgi:hypothetical protein
MVGDASRRTLLWGVGRGTAAARIASAGEGGCGDGMVSPSGALRQGLWVTPSSARSRAVQASASAKMNPTSTPERVVRTTTGLPLP